MNKFIPVHEVTYNSWQQVNEETSRFETCTTRHINANPTYVNIDLIQQIVKTGDNDTDFYFGKQEKITVDGSLEDIIKLIYA